MRTILTLIVSLLIMQEGTGQTNLLLTHPEALGAMLGTHDVEDYLPANIINQPADVIDGIVAEVSPDTLKAYLEKLSRFENRNTGSDTLSNDFGIGAARRWAFAKMQSFSERHENRLLTSYFQFDQSICGMDRHRNVLGVLPGIGPNRNEIVLMEAHIDSRCAGPCDIDCMAHGAEDNGSGSALLLELTRVMSRFAYDRTLVFMLTTGEEQGLFGANAFAEFCEQEGIRVRGVYNNDVIGGIICGQTASPPGCPGLNDIDSTNVRIYSSGGDLLGTSNSRLLARFVQLQYEENVAPSLPFANTIRIQSSEDRGGRGGDHI
ncbi:MAG TPA: M28 family peptidase, partial [Phaeodactylibacter sp.]|nr:M28 family peptidase [Phaeodactylibacter sp.]